MVPGFPDLDGGIHGHSGTYHKNGMSTGIRDKMDQGYVLQYVERGHVYGLFMDAEKKSLFVYDAANAVPRQFLTNGAVDYDDYRMSTARSAKLVGDSQFEWESNGWGDAKIHFHGHYRYLKEAVFSYRVKASELLEGFAMHDTVGGAWIAQHLYFPQGNEALEYLLGRKLKGVVSEQGDLAFFSCESEGKTCLMAVKGAAVDATGKVTLTQTTTPSSVTIAYWAGKADQLDAAKTAMLSASGNFADAAKALPSKTKGSPKPQWAHVFSGKGVLADESAFKTPYVIDTLPVPILNPYDSPMVLSGIAFNEKGDAFVATMFGDVWKVTGINHTLEKVTWKRMIAGLNSPFGLTYADGKLYVGDKSELIALHDLNGDDEFDFVERANQGFEPLGRNVHAGIPRDSKGAVYYITSSGVMKLHDDKSEWLSPPSRTAMAIGVTHEDRVWSAPQEGGWTPASVIFEHHDGDDFYRPGRDHKTLEDIQGALDPGLVYIPRGIDNSTGGFATVRSRKFGLLGDKMLNLSWSACSAQLVLRDKPEGATRYQGAIIPLEGNYLSGLRYGASHPEDGQLYLVGHDGWGTYAVSDGCLQRLRYTGAPSYLPTSFRTYANGIKLGFDEKLDKATAEDTKNLLVKQWNYIYSNAYGSPEYSVKQPRQEGHDMLTVKSAHLLNGGKTLFVEVPDLDPAMSLHVYGQLKSEAQKDVELNIVMTAHYLQDAFTGFPGGQKTDAPVAGGPQLELPMMITGLKSKTIPDSVKAKATTIQVDANNQLRFILDEENMALLNSIKVGDRVVFRVSNIEQGDGIAHNALVIDKKYTQEVGIFCDTHSSSLIARQKSYVPLYDKEMAKKVLAHSILIAPQETDEFLYEAKSAGERTLICTFPGHWGIMRLDFTVKEK